MVFGEQFHAEVDIKSNQGKPMIYNFLSMALKEKEKISPSVKRKVKDKIQKLD